MNKEYVFKDGKALVIDENDNQKTIDYYDNLDEVLEQENLIEIMENKIKELESETYKYKNNSKFWDYFFVVYPFLAFTFVPLIFGGFINKIFGINAPIINVPMFGTLKTTTLLSLMLSIPGAMYSLASYFKLKDEEKKKKGEETQLEYLKKALVEEKEYLKTLKLVKTNSKEREEFYVSKIDNSEILKNIKKFLLFYYDLGYNEEKYYKYYEQGKLEQKLGKYYNDNGLNTVKEHLEEKGPKLVKRKTNIYKITNKLDNDK